MKEELYQIKERVFEINSKLSESSLVIQNFGNASSRFSEGFVIKPSGVDLSNSNLSEMVALDFDGNKLDGLLKPSSDEPTHRIIYKTKEEVGGIVHTHSKFATAFAQAKLKIDNFGTTHSDFSKYSILVTDQLNKDQVKKDYELNTGIKILEKLQEEGLEILEVPGILSVRHGVFAWGNSIQEAYNNAEIIEYVAEMCFITRNLNPDAKTIEEYIAEKHFNRKHGPNKYYGQ